MCNNISKVSSPGSEEHSPWWLAEELSGRVAIDMMITGDRWMIFVISAAIVLSTEVMTWKWSGLYCVWVSAPPDGMNDQIIAEKLGWSVILTVHLFDHSWAHKLGQWKQVWDRGSRVTSDFLCYWMAALLQPSWATLKRLKGWVLQAEIHVKRGWMYITSARQAFQTEKSTRSPEINPIRVASQWQGSSRQTSHSDVPQSFFSYTSYTFHKSSRTWLSYEFHTVKSLR